jgi:Zn-dependent peptidase ImmA (M78 family)
MRRGFKAEAERLAVRLRAELGVPPLVRADVDQLAHHLGIDVREAQDLVAADDLQRLNDLQPGCFSAATIYLPNGAVVAVVNSVATSTARRDSDLAHEVAHVALRHHPRHVDRLGELTFFDCDAEQEEEANWLAGCLLLPRTLLLAEARLGRSVEQIATRHNVSIDMARFRLNTSGVYFQIAKTRRSPGL